MLLQAIYAAFLPPGEEPKKAFFNLPNPEVPYATMMQQLEFVFRQLNHVDGTEAVAKRQDLRSLSVGDMVRISLGKWRVDSFGWSRWDVNTQQWVAVTNLDKPQP